MSVSLPSWASLSVSSAERWPFLSMVPPSGASQIETCLAPSFFVHDLPTDLVDDEVVG